MYKEGRVLEEQRMAAPRDNDAYSPGAPPLRRPCGSTAAPRDDTSGYSPIDVSSQGAPPSGRTCQSTPGLSPEKTKDSQRGFWKTLKRVRTTAQNGNAHEALEKAARAFLYFRRTSAKREPGLDFEQCRWDPSPRVRTRVTRDAAKDDDDQLLVWSKLPRPDADTRRVIPVRTVHVRRKVTE